MITLNPIVSSLIAAIGYDGPSQVLAVRFKARSGEPVNSGPLYYYRNVTPDMFEKMTEPGGSIGGYFTREIKAAPGSFPYALQREPEQAA